MSGKIRPEALDGKKEGKEGKEAKEAKAKAKE